MEGDHFHVKLLTQKNCTTFLESSTLCGRTAQSNSIRTIKRTYRDHWVSYEVETCIRHKHICSLFITRKQNPGFRPHELFVSTLLLSMENAVKFQQSFEKFLEVKRSQSRKLLTNWDIKYEKTSQVNISSYTVQFCFFQIVCHDSYK